MADFDAVEIRKPVLACRIVKKMAQRLAPGSEPCSREVGNHSALLTPSGDLLENGRRFEPLSVHNGLARQLHHAFDTPPLKWIASTSESLTVAAPENNRQIGGDEAQQNWADFRPALQPG